MTDQGTSVPPEAVEAAREVMLAGGTVAEMLEAAAPHIQDEDAPEWVWADPISEDFLVKGAGHLHCKRCNEDLEITGGLIELWELALDAKRHHDEKHGADLIGDPQ